MTKLVEIDERVGIFKQMEEDVGGPVILINKFSVSPEEFEQFLEGWAAEAEKFKEQPGFISTQLHKGMGVAVPSLTMQFGNRQDISRGR
jgi:hypothetical protein